MERFGINSRGDCGGRVEETKFCYEFRATLCFVGDLRILSIDVLVSYIFQFLELVGINPKFKYYKGN